MCDMGALIERLVGVGETVAPGVQPRQDLAALGYITGQRERGKKVKACTGGLQVVLDFGVPSPGRMKSARATDSPNKAPSNAFESLATRPRPLLRRQRGRRLIRWPDQCE